ncbi:MAG: DNA repair protein RecN, partial [Pseudomonadota bacterium]
MLNQLIIKDLVLIDNLVIDFTGGFNVITGETGAGKSLILKAIDLVLGAKGTAKLIRPNCNELIVSGIFQQIPLSLKAKLSELGINITDELVIRRHLSSNNRSRCYINDQPINLGTISAFGNELININSQHSTQQIINQEFLLNLIDQIGANSLLLTTIGNLYQQITGLKQELATTLEQIAIYQEQQQFIESAFNELNTLNLLPDEELNLIDNKRNLISKQQAASKIDYIHHLLGGEVDLGQKLRSAQLALLKLGELPNFDRDGFVTKLEQAENLVAEVIDNLAIDAEPVAVIDAQLDQIEERLSKIKMAERRFGMPASELADYCRSLGEKLDLINNQQLKQQQLTKQLATLYQQYQQQAAVLSNSRGQVIAKLVPKLTTILAQLNLAQIRLELNLKPLAEGRISASGIDQAQLLVSTNPGQPLTTLADTASGGELARFTLAWLIMACHHLKLATTIFDEIDVGVGGATATSIGQAMHNLGQAQQVITISHQPQVAALADYHVHVEKQQQQQHTKVTITALNQQQRLNELARMLSAGSISKEALAAAKQLMPITKQSVV